MAERPRRSRSVLEPAAREDVRLELRFHLDERVRELVRKGVPESEARARAEHELGPLEEVSGDCERIAGRVRRRRGRREAFVHACADGWDGLRQLRRRPGASGAVIAVVTLAVASTTAAASLVWGTLFRPLPLSSPDRVVAVHTVDGRVENAPLRGSAAPGDVIDWRELASFASVTALNTAPVTIFAGDEPERVVAVLVAQDVAAVLGVDAHLGRMFTASDWLAGSGAVTLLTYDHWRRAFGADSAVIGRTIGFGGGSAEVVGVLPETLPRLAPGIDGDVWLPFDLAENTTRGGTYLRVVGRLRDGVGIAAAQAELDALMARLAREEPTTNALRSAWIEPLAASLTWSSRPVLGFVGLAIGFVVLIACVNVAVLLLARASERVGEIALRRVLGAGPVRLGRLFLTESAVCCALGALLGFPLGGVAVRGFLARYPGGLPRGDEVGDGPVVWAVGAVLVLLLTALGALPLYRSLREIDVGSELLSGSRVSGSRAAERFRSVLVAAQVALCTFLLVSGALLLEVYRKVVETPTGFRDDQLVAFSLTPPAARYPGQAEYLGFYDGLLERMRAQPGVAAASYTSLLPFDRDNWTEGMSRYGVSPETEDPLFVLLQRVEPSYPDVLGLPLLAGRQLTTRDREGTPPVGVVNESLARRMFGRSDALGERIGSGDRWIEVVGVVGDKRHRDLTQEPLLELFVPRRQDRTARTLWVVVRSTEDPATLLPRLRELVREADPTIPFANATVLSERIALSILPQRFRSTLLATLAGVAVVLATLGVWGLASFRVSRRTGEIGVRIALGMEPGRACAAVLGSALLTASCGVAAGAGFTLACARLVDLGAFGMPPVDAGTLGGVAAFLLLVTALASLRPAWRASSVDPLEAIRST